MDDRRFDAFVRLLATGSSRRQLVKGLLALGGVAAAGARVPSAEAARRPTPTPRPVTCPGQQTLQDGVCACPPNTTGCGPDCCPAGAQCCDNACCYGVCVGEELCCTPVCAEGACGDDGCGGTCPCSPDKVCSQGACVCPSATAPCPDGVCRQCCELSNTSPECAATQGGDASCWACSAPGGPGDSNRACFPWGGGCTIPDVGPGTCDADHFCVPRPG